MIKFVVGSLLAGMFIGLGADMQSAILSGGFSPYLAAFAFSLGLCSVRFCEVPLYTGKVGTVFEVGCILEELLVLLAMFILNAIGASIVSFFPWSCDWWYASVPLHAGWLVLPSAMVCGGLVHVATRQQRSYLATMLCVAVFIIAGGQHCVANAYHVAKIGFTAESIAFLFQCALGNALGAWLAWLVEGIEEQ